MLQGPPLNTVCMEFPEQGPLGVFNLSGDPRLL